MTSKKISEITNLKITKLIEEFNMTIIYKKDMQTLIVFLYVSWIQLEILMEFESSLKAESNEKCLGINLANIVEDFLKN